MEYKGYKIESIKNDGHLQRNAFGIYKNGKLISTAETSKEAQHEIDNIMYRPVTIEYIIVNKKNDSKSRETIKTTESDVDKKIKELERKYSNDTSYYLRDIRKVYDMKTIDKLDKAIHTIDASIKLVKTVEKKNGYAIHIVEGGYGERIVLTFPGESYSNPHMWLGENNASNMNSAKKLLNDFAK
jgi:hypothetical protein